MNELTDQQKTEYTQRLVDLVRGKLPEHQSTLEIMTAITDCVDGNVPFSDKTWQVIHAMKELTCEGQLDFIGVTA